MWPDHILSFWCCLMTIQFFFKFSFVYWQKLYLVAWNARHKKIVAKWMNPRWSKMILKTVQHSWKFKYPKDQGQLHNSSDTGKNTVLNPSLQSDIISTTDSSQVQCVSQHGLTLTIFSTDPFELAGKNSTGPHGWCTSAASDSMHELCTHDADFQTKRKVHVPEFVRLISHWNNKRRLLFYSQYIVLIKEYFKCFKIIFIILVKIHHEVLLPPYSAVWDKFASSPLWLVTWGMD